MKNIVTTYRLIDTTDIKNANLSFSILTSQVCPGDFFKRKGQPEYKKKPPKTNLLRGLLGLAEQKTYLIETERNIRILGPNPRHKAYRIMDDSICEVAIIRIAVFNSKARIWHWNRQAS